MVRLFGFGKRRDIVSFGRTEDTFMSGVIPDSFRLKINSTIHLPYGSITLSQGIHDSDAWYFFQPDKDQFSKDVKQIPALKHFLKGFYVPCQNHSKWLVNADEFQNEMIDLAKKSAKSSNLPNEHYAVFHELYIIMRMVHGNTQREVNHNHCKFGFHKNYWALINGEYCVFDLSQGIYQKRIKFQDVARYYVLDVVNDKEAVTYVH